MAELPDQPALDLVTFALHTGLRQGEQFGLRWEWIDFNARTLRLPVSKNGYAHAVPLNDTVLDILRRQARPLEGGRIWRVPNRNSAHNFYQRVFVPALKRASIEDFRWHDLRHTFASRLVMAGEDIRTVADLLGHRNIQMTMRYAHLSPGHRLTAVQKLLGGQRINLNVQSSGLV